MNTVSAEKTVPVFAVLGHPNEGKSSVVSTLTENDQIPVSQVPGETQVAGEYTVMIDGHPIISFVDTPGFQVPRQTLAWFREHPGPDSLDRFIQTHRADPFFSDDCELLGPVAQGAGIIYVVDGARPVRGDDLAEMEILRLTGCPRMAVINPKRREPDYTEDWKTEFRKHFNAVRVFDSNRADFFERIRMLESLKAIDQEREADIAAVIQAFKEEWDKRNRLACAHIVHSIEKALGFSLSEKIGTNTDPVTLKETLTIQYQNEVRRMERQLFRQIRQIFRHRLYDYLLPDYSVLRHDLFSGRTWELLGLTRGQLTAAGAVVGGSVGAVADTAAAGLSFGVFTAIGTALGAGSAMLGVKNLARKKTLGGDQLKVGPNENIQLLYILLDRAVLYYAHIVKRAHGRRILEEPAPGENTGKQGISSGLTPARHKTCSRFFRAARGRGVSNRKKAGQQFALLVSALLEEAAGSLDRDGKN
jgi:hypothetical protein